MTTLEPRHAEILRHMLGMRPDKPKGSYGYRNYFCAEVGGDDYIELCIMEDALLVQRGAAINEGRDRYFHATREGCAAIGLHHAAIKRALGR